MSSAMLPVRAISWLLWVLVASGPLLGGAALLRPIPTPVAADAAAVPMGVDGLAELAVLAHLSALPGEANPWLSPALPAMRLTGSALEGLSGEEQAAAGSARDRVVLGAAAVQAIPAGPGRWGVTVAVLRAELIEAWQVTVASSTEGLLIETMPALVGLPTAAEAPVPAIPALRPPAQDDPLARAVDGFLSALLTGDGDLSRYLAVGAAVEQPAVRGRSVQLRRVAARPLDDRRVAALAEVRMIRDDGAVHVLHYPLLLQPAGGRWEIAGLLPALPLQPSPPATTTP